MGDAAVSEGFWQGDPGVPAAHTWYHRAYSRWWDWRHGVSTCGDILPDRLGMHAEPRSHSTDYMPTHPRYLGAVLDSLPLPPDHFTLIDFGSGKGRVLAAALAYPFREIIGIEAAAELHAAAERNLRNYRGRRRCSQARSLCADVRDFALPMSPAVFYFFHPFAAAVMRPVLANIADSLARAPRECLLVYVNPVLASLVEDLGVFQPLASSAYSRIWRFLPPGDVGRIPG